MKKSFTLAEVLITLGIIGVVAAMTMPTLVNKYKEQETVTRVKKFYSVFSQAYTMAILENGTIDTWGLTNSELVPDENGNSIHSEASLKNSNLFIEKVNPYLKKVKFEPLKNTDDSLGYVLADGTRIVRVWFSLSACTSDPKVSCGDFYIATNNKPLLDENGKLRSHVFNFQIFQDAIVPFGSRGAVGWHFENECKTGKMYERCTAWVILNGNMDYLHCPDELRWNGKTKCSR